LVIVIWLLVILTNFPKLGILCKLHQNGVYLSAATVTLLDQAVADYDNGGPASKIGCIRFAWRARRFQQSSRP